MASQQQSPTMLQLVPKKTRSECTVPRPSPHEKDPWPQIK